MIHHHSRVELVTPSRAPTIQPRNIYRPHGRRKYVLFWTFENRVVNRIAERNLKFKIRFQNDQIKFDSL